MPLDYLKRRSIIPISPTILKTTTDGSLPDPGNVQGDIYPTFPKGAEIFIFFTISDATQFRSELQTFTPTTFSDVYSNLEKINNAKKAAAQNGTAVNQVDMVQMQIAFSRAGLNFLGLNESTADPRFDKGSMRLDKVALGDQAKWDDLFDSGSTHGVIMIATKNVLTCSQASDDIKAKFKSSTSRLDVISGYVRPDRNSEHFGYRDGVSQPALRGVTDPHPGQIQVDPGVIIIGYPGDPFLSTRPSWTKDGSIMVFRKLEQDVPGFTAYLGANGPNWRQFVPGGTADPPLSDSEGAELFGARMVGRWKSGTPLALAPVRDDPSIGTDPDKTNNFDYTIPGQTRPSDYNCPFTAHTRKTAPRNLDPFIQQKFLESAAIVRAGIKYGKEVKADPKAQRGLLFVCYQSSLDQGFFLQTTGFANNDYFPITGIKPTKHGQDPIIGGPPSLASILGVSGDVRFNLQIESDSGVMMTTGIATALTNSSIQPSPGAQPFFVTSHGGEYFFVPSISTLQMLANLPGNLQPTIVSKPTSKGIYRIKTFGSDSYYMQLFPGGNHYVQVTSRDNGTDKQKWTIVPRDNDKYTITSLYDNSGLVSSKFGYRGYIFPQGFKDCASDTWEIKEQTSGSDKFSKIRNYEKPGPLGFIDTPVVCSITDQFDHPNQRWEFELLETLS